MKKIFFIAGFLVIMHNSAFCMNQQLQQFQGDREKSFLAQAKEQVITTIKKYHNDPELKPFMYGAAFATTVSSTVAGYCQFTDGCAERSPEQVLFCASVAFFWLCVGSGFNIVVENALEAKKTKTKN